MSSVLNNEMPADPFSEGTSDFTQLAANCHAMYAAFVASGFTDEQAFRFTVAVTTSMMVATHKAKQGED